MICMLSSLSVGVVVSPTYFMALPIGCGVKLATCPEEVGHVTRILRSR